MLVLTSEMTVPGLTGTEVTSFLLEPDDARYQQWWPGTHLQFHVVRRGPRGDHVGDVVLMDEYVGTRRVRMNAEVVGVVPGEWIEWRLRARRLRLPVRVTLALADDTEAVRLRHTITAGWRGAAAVLDPVWRLVFSRSFATAMDEHARTEFRLLRDVIRAEPADPPPG